LAASWDVPGSVPNEPDSIPTLKLQKNALEIKIKWEGGKEKHPKPGKNKKMCLLLEQGPTCPSRRIWRSPLPLEPRL
jgi:hypothetical protein